MEYEEIIEKANNMSANDILDTYNLLEEGIRHYFSRLCSGISKDNPHELDIDIEGTFGLHESEKIKYLSCFEDSEGIIWFKIGDDYEYYVETREIDDITKNELVYIIGELEHLGRYIR